MKIVLPIALVFFACVNLASASAAEQQKVECRGVIKEFNKAGFQALPLNGECEVFDVTWVVVKSPEEFAGRRHMLLSRSPEDRSPYGKIGDLILFTAFKATLESDNDEPIRGESKAKSNQSSQPSRAFGPRG